MTDIKTQFKEIETKVVHAGEPVPRIMDSVAMPVFQSSIYDFGRTLEIPKMKYLRLNNSPNHDVLHDKIANLEGSERALVSSSGMASIATTLLANLGTGDHVLLQDGIFGGTYSFVSQILSKLGITFDLLPTNEPDLWESKLNPKTKLIYTESINNPLMQVIDHQRVVDFAKKHKLLAVIDNTFTSPLNFRPIEFGYDVSLHSCSKYLNGHSDLIAGAVCGSKEMIDKIDHLQMFLGQTLDPHACSLLHRGIKTLSVRMTRQCESAIKIATALSEHKKIKEVHYPGLKTDASFKNATKFFKKPGAMLSFEIDGGIKELEKFIKRLKIILHAPSLGGVESVICVPALTSYAMVSPEERVKLGISDTLVRFSTGIEGCEELTSDIVQALD